MKIVCTKKQKKWFIWYAERRKFCPFIGFIGSETDVCCNNCKVCIENNIDWDIIDDCPAK